MINIRIDRRNHHITGLEISGHAGSAEYGKDLVCAGVSAIGFGLLNALDQMTGESDLSAEDNRISIKIHHPDQTTDTIMETGLIQLKTIAEVNQNYIKINEWEVQ